MMFSEFVEFIKSNEGAHPSAAEINHDAPSAIIGAALPRIDGPLKTTGKALYASDYNFPNMVYAVPVCATIASGKIRRIDSSAAEKMPGVLLVLHHGNIIPLYRNASGGRNSESRPAFEDETVYYWGQYVAAVIAETYEQARAAAEAVHVDYDADKFTVATALDHPLPPERQPGRPRVLSHRRDSQGAFGTAAGKVDE